MGITAGCVENVTRKETQHGKYFVVKSRFALIIRHFFLSSILLLLTPARLTVKHASMLCLTPAL